MVCRPTLVSFPFNPQTTAKPKRTLRSQVGLHTLSFRSSRVVDVLARAVRSHERDRLDPRLLAEELDGRNGSMEDGKDALGKTCAIS